jgi:osmotically-inducible protein OsmY
MRWDTDLADNVCNELFWDLEVDNDAIAVSAEARTVTLRGIVGSLREMRAAKNS